jgi:hypothetical protein
LPRQRPSDLAPNKGLQADGGTAVVFGLVAQSEVGGSSAPAAEPWPFGVKGTEEVQRKYTTTHVLKRPVWHDICGGCHSSLAPSGLVALSSESIRWDNL